MVGHSFPTAVRTAVYVVWSLEASAIRHEVKHQTARWPDMKLTRSCDLLHGSICLLSAHFQAPCYQSFALHAIACFYSFHGCTVDLSCSAA